MNNVRNFINSHMVFPWSKLYKRPNFTAINLAINLTSDTSCNSLWLANQEWQVRLEIFRSSNTCWLQSLYTYLSDLTDLLRTVSPAGLIRCQLDCSEYKERRWWCKQQCTWLNRLWRNTKTFVTASVGASLCRENTSLTELSSTTSPLHEKRLQFQRTSLQVGWQNKGHLRPSTARCPKVLNNLNLLVTKSIIN